MPSSVKSKFTLFSKCSTVESGIKKCLKAYLNNMVCLRTDLLGKNNSMQIPIGSGAFYDNKCNSCEIQKYCENKKVTKRCKYTFNANNIKYLYHTSLLSDKLLIVPSLEEIDDLVQVLKGG